MSYREYNFDGLVGPTHNYAGLGSGNLASMASRHHVSSPKAAALEGLAKMKLLAEMGVPQAVLPPQRRPHVGYLRTRYGKRSGATGRGEAETSAEPARPSKHSGTGLPSADQWHQSYGGTGRTHSDAGDPCRGDAANPDTGLPPQTACDPCHESEMADLLRRAAENGEEGRRDLAIASSASAMWAANAATVSPSPDTADGRCHFTIANLVSQPHRALEAEERHRLFAHMFGDMMQFDVHPPQPVDLPDEGAANHNRLTRGHGERGVEVFIHGSDWNSTQPKRQRFKPRQSGWASERNARFHGLNLEGGLTLAHSFEQLAASTAYIRRQNYKAVDAGVFHNDVICVANEDALLIHEMAWTHVQDQRNSLDYLRRKFEEECRANLHVGVVLEQELPLPDAVRSYLFNSQLVTLPSGSMALIYPAECDEVPSARAAIERILREDNPVEQAVRVDVRQSMKNGGGPACLRLRVVLSDEEKAAVRGNVFWTPRLHETLVDWVTRHYRDALTPADLADVRLWQESEAALEELAEILQLPI